MNKDYYFNHLHNLFSNRIALEDKTRVFNQYNPVFVQIPRGSNRNLIYYDTRVLHKLFDFDDNYRLEMIKNGYRKSIEENKYGRIANPGREISIPRIQCTKSYRGNIKYASRRFLNDMGK